MDEFGREIVEVEGAHKMPPILCMQNLRLQLLKPDIHLILRNSFFFSSMNSIGFS